MAWLDAQKQAETAELKADTFPDWMVYGLMLLSASAAAIVGFEVGQHLK